MISTGDITISGLFVPCTVYGNFDGVNAMTVHHKWLYGITKQCAGI
jgi:hypothetical protein